jgi:hypothetical protein
MILVGLIVDNQNVKISLDKFKFIFIKNINLISISPKTNKFFEYF